NVQNVPADTSARTSSRRSRRADDASRIAAMQCTMRRIARRMASCQPAVNRTLAGRDIGEGQRSVQRSTARDDDWSELSCWHRVTLESWPEVRPAFLVPTSPFKTADVSEKGTAA